ncbi:MAG: competence/damage-inducible protein A [Actinobacteria bacterium]|nr:competence/damage-inducible protein A [Actinomycetota bacterium]
MRAEIIAVGTELLIGQIANTNAQKMSSWLADIGVDVMFHTTVGDNEERIASTISKACARCDVVIITGGLGPTHDDLTREAIARSTNRPLGRDPLLEQQLRERFANFGREMAPENLKQADLPEGASPLPNPRGTAPGVMLQQGDVWIFAVPGVPSEMEHMMRELVLPHLSALAGQVRLVSRVLKVAGIGESDLAHRIAPVIEGLQGASAATIALLASAGEVKIRVSAKGTEDQAQSAIAPVEVAIRQLLGELVFGVDDETLEGVIGEMMIAKKMTVAVAESFTGGMVLSRLVDAPGTSDFLLGGYVTYSNEVKIDDLSVPSSMIEEHGAVSAEVAVHMAKGARARTGADLGLSTTGEAGPEPEEKPVGTMFLGLAWEGGATHRQIMAPGGRAAVRRWGTTASLNLLRLFLLGKVDAD